VTCHVPERQGRWHGNGALHGTPAITTGMPVGGAPRHPQGPQRRIQPITARPRERILARPASITRDRKVYRQLDLHRRWVGGIAGSNRYGSGTAGNAPIYGGAFRTPVSFRSGTAAPPAWSAGSRQAARTAPSARNPFDWKTRMDSSSTSIRGFALDPATGNSPGSASFRRQADFWPLIVTPTYLRGRRVRRGGSSFQYGLDFRTGGYVGNDALSGQGLTSRNSWSAPRSSKTSDG